MQQSQSKSQSSMQDLAKLTLLSCAAFTSSAAIARTPGDEPLQVPATAPNNDPITFHQSETSKEPLSALTLPVRPKSANQQILPDSRQHSLSVTTSSPATSVEKPKTTKELLIALTGALCSLTAMGWYYQQLKRKETVASLTSLSIGAANDVLLCGAAFLTGQGITAVATTGAFSLGGMLCILEARKQKDQSIKLNLTEKLCIGLSIPGLMMLTATQIPKLATFTHPALLATASSVLGVTVNAIALLPLALKLIEPMQSSELPLDISRGRLRAMLSPVLPFVVGTTGLGIALLNIPSLSFGHLFQPLSLFASSLALTALVPIWSYRRLPKS